MSIPSKELNVVMSKYQRRCDMMTGTDVFFRRRFDINVVKTLDQRDDVALASMRRGEMTKWDRLD